MQVTPNPQLEGISVQGANVLPQVSGLFIFEAPLQWSPHAHGSLGDGWLHVWLMAKLTDT